MTKELRCQDMGFDCDAVVVSGNEDEVLAQVTEHAKSVHGMSDEQNNDPNFGTRVRAQIHDQA